jgi:hypothetical protein
VSGGKDAAYAAGQARTFLRGELEGRDPRFVREFAGLVQDPETLDYLNYMCSLYADDEEDYLDTPDARDIIASAGTATTTDAFEFGNVSQLQGIVGLVDRSEDGKAAIVRLATALSNEGMIALMVGPPGSGKTTTAGDVAMTWKALTGGVIVSNSQDFDGTDQFVESDREAKEAMTSTPRPCLLFVDELEQSLTSRGTDAPAANEFAKSLKFIRKTSRDYGQHAKRGSFLGVGHTKKGTAADIRRLATLVAQKPSQTDPGQIRIYESEGGKDTLDDAEEYSGLTDSSFNTDEHEPSTFVVGLDDDEDDGEDVDPAAVRREEAIATAIRCVAAGDTYQEAAKRVPYGKSWVGDRWTEFRDGGQHRELVDMEPPEGETV